MFNFTYWLSRFKHYNPTSKTEEALSNIAVTDETSFNAVAEGSILVRDDGETFVKNAKGAWSKKQTVATDSTFGGVKVEWLDASTVNIVTKE